MTQYYLSLYSQGKLTKHYKSQNYIALIRRMLGHDGEILFTTLPNKDVQYVEYSETPSLDSITVR